MKYLIAPLLLCLVAAPLSAKKKVFYDSKSNIVGITGDYNFLKSTDKFYPLNVQIPTDSYSSPKDKCEYWNKLNFGKKILDELFCYDGNSLSEERLKELALQNVLKADDERASIGVIGKDNILKEDYLPILENQYIFINQSTRKRQMCYRCHSFDFCKSSVFLYEQLGCFFPVNSINKCTLVIFIKQSSYFVYSKVTPVCLSHSFLYLNFVWISQELTIS